MMLFQIGSNYLTQGQKPDDEVKQFPSSERVPGHRPLVEDMDAALGIIDGTDKPRLIEILFCMG